MSDLEVSKKTRKEKKEKKDKLIESNNGVEEIFSVLKGKRKNDEIENVPAAEVVEVKKKALKVKHVEEDEEEVVTRRRTRSLSNADEVYPIGITADQFHKDHQITVKGNADSGSGNYVCPAPMVSFASTPFAPPIKKALEAAGFANPTPTQAQAWPIALSGRDVITVAKTGSGKTCGFLLPGKRIYIFN